jgi:hypothetical protein
MPKRKTILLIINKYHIKIFLAYPRNLNKFIVRRALSRLVILIFTFLLILGTFPTVETFVHHPEC